MSQAIDLHLRDLIDKPFDLLQAIERRCLDLVQVNSAEGGDTAEWVGIGFKVGNEMMLVTRDEIREVMMVPAWRICAASYCLLSICASTLVPA
jgi:hypothetical protein